MIDHTCAFCAHVFVGRRRKFCFDCLPEYNAVSPSTYMKAYNDLSRACGFNHDGVLASKWSPPGGWPKPTKPTKPDHPCTGCDTMIASTRTWCSNKCRAMNKRRAVRSARSSSLSPAPLAPVVVLRWVDGAAICACRNCGAEFKRCRQRFYSCSDECAKALKRDVNRRKNMARRTAEVGVPYTLAELAASSNSRCCICRRRVDMSLSGRDPAGPTVEHFLTLSAGGADCRTNVGLAHNACNTARSDRAIVQLPLGLVG